MLQNLQFFGPEVDTFKVRRAHNFYTQTILLAVFWTASLLLTNSAAAQPHLSITSPSSSGTKIASPRDYATDVLGNPWDMDSAGDLANYIDEADIYNITPPTFSSGVMSFTTTGGLPYFYMLSPGQCSANNIGKNGQHYPIDSTLYRYLTFRIYASDETQIQVIWHTGCDYGSNWVKTVQVNVPLGWHTVTMDLQTIGHDSFNGSDLAWNAKPVTGLRINPTFDPAGIEIKFDSIRLTNDPGAPGEYAVDHNFSPSAAEPRYSIFVDDDLDPFNGYRDRVVTGSSTETSAVVSSKTIEPGSYNVIGFTTQDFATSRGTPWDMNERSDVILSNEITEGTSFTNGMYTGFTGNDPYFFLYLPTAITASNYCYLTIAMDSASNGQSNVFWFSTSGSVLGMKFFPTTSGYSEYQIDLCGSANWSGNTIGSLRIGPNPNSSFAISYIALASNSYINDEDDLSPPIVSAPEKLAINFPPIPVILQPDCRGGVDYALSQQGDAWDFRNPEDVVGAFNLSTAEILPNNNIVDLKGTSLQGDFFHGVNANLDPYQESLNTLSQFEPTIDATRFSNLVYKIYVNQPQNVNTGSTARVIYQVDDESSPKNGDDQFVQDGWQEYCQDLTELGLEAALHPPGSFKTPAWRGNVRYFRLDAHEFSAPTDYFIDYIKVTANDEANTAFGLTWTVIDPDDDPSDVSFSAFRTSSKSASGGSAFGSPVFGSEDSRVEVVNTTSVANGTYYIYGTANDGYNSVSRLATGKLTVNHNLTQDNLDPELDAYFPTTGKKFINSLTVYGYAIDDTQIALVEFLIDDELLHTAVPALFDKDVRDSHLGMADSSNSGFYETFDTTSVPTGTHTLLIRAIDTAGNVSSKTVSVQKVTSGADTPPPFPGGDNESPVDIPTTGSKSLLLKSVKYSVKSNTLKVLIKNGNKCPGEITLRGATNANTLSEDPDQAVFMKSVVSNGKASQSMKAKRPNRIKQSNKVYLGLYCNGSFQSSRAFKAKKLNLDFDAAKPVPASKWFQKVGKKLK